MVFRAVGQFGCRDIRIVDTVEIGSRAVCVPHIDAQLVAFGRKRKLCARITTACSVSSANRGEDLLKRTFRGLAVEAVVEHGEVRPQLTLGKPGAVKDECGDSSPEEVAAVG